MVIGLYKVQLCAAATDDEINGVAANSYTTMVLSLGLSVFWPRCIEIYHFTRAAEATNITQPALSMQIRTLEDAVGARLV